MRSKLIKLMKLLVLALFILPVFASPRWTWTGYGREFIGWQGRTASAMLVCEWDGWWAYRAKSAGVLGSIVAGPFKTAERARERAEADIK